MTETEKELLIALAKDVVAIRNSICDGHKLPKSGLADILARYERALKSQKEWAEGLNERYHDRQH